MSTANGKQATVEMIPAVRVVAKRDGFRRAGRAWPASGAVVKRSEMTKKQLDELCAEPALVIQFTEIPAEPKAEAETKDDADKRPEPEKTEAKESAKTKEKK